MLLLEFAGFFTFILLFGYVLAVGPVYWRYNVRTTAADEALRIQPRRPRAGQVRREILLSLLTIAIFAIGATALLELYKAGETGIYAIGARPAWFGILMFFVCIAVHDTWFYWTHRFMHWRRVFKYWHAPHHKSVTPTAWAIFAFSPLEAVTQFAGLALMVMYLPLSPLTLLAFLTYDTAINTAGHCGFELTPRWLSRSWLWWPFSTVSSHDRHHTNMRVNFGSFLNVWDRICGTEEL
jgi:sterol desaturase/sphingolipid hydroxylase (fatty acid hydroxylase superfamily)